MDPTEGGCDVRNCLSSFSHTLLVKKRCGNLPRQARDERNERFQELKEGYICICIPFRGAAAAAAAAAAPSGSVTLAGISPRPIL